MCLLKNSEYPILEQYLKQMSNISKLQPFNIKNKISDTYSIDYNIMDLDFLICKLYSQKEPELFLEYQNESQQFIKEYQTFNNKNNVITFGNSFDSSQKNNELQEKKLQVIKNYLEIAEKYLPLDICYEYPKNNHCFSCDFNLDDVYIDDDGFQYCPKCGTERIIYFGSVRSISLNSGVKKEYEDRKNFWIALMKYQCKQQTRFPEKKMFQSLDKYFQRKGIQSREEIRQMPLNNNGTRGKTSRNMLITALGETGYSDYYVDCSLIGLLYWNWKAPNVSHLEEKIMEDYEATQKIFLMLIHQKIFKNIDRDSSPNIQFRLFRHLQLVNHPCVSEDFKIVKTPEILENLEVMWKIMCQGTGLNYIPFHI